MTDDPILSLLLSDHGEYRFAEEQLFYVALTRTKNDSTFLHSDTSIFRRNYDNDYPLTNFQGRTKATFAILQNELVIKIKNGDNFLGCHYLQSNL